MLTAMFLSCNLYQLMILLNFSDGVQVMEHGASARFDSGDLFTDTDVTPATAKNGTLLFLILLK